MRRLAITIALAAFGLAAPVASAGEDEVIEVRGGYVLFLDEGELLRAVDQVKDGKGIRARLGYSGTSSTVTAVGVGELEEKHLSIRENAKVWLQVCYTKKGRDVQCSQFQRGTA